MATTIAPTTLAAALIIIIVAGHSLLLSHLLGSSSSLNVVFAALVVNLLFLYCSVACSARGAKEAVQTRKSALLRARLLIECRSS